jgi:CBS-domain-containing membrane protein
MLSAQLPGVVTGPLIEKANPPLAVALAVSSIPSGGNATGCTPAALSVVLLGPTVHEATWLEPIAPAPEGLNRKRMRSQGGVVAVVT